MKDATLISRTKYKWDRNRTFYFVSAVLAEPSSDDGWPEIPANEISAHNASLLSGWRGHLIQLKSPILCHDDIRRIIVGNGFRIYPPFDLCDKEGISGALNGVSIPVGPVDVEKKMDLPDYAIKGLNLSVNSADAKQKYGLRIDIRDGTELEPLIEYFLRTTRQYTNQWWVSSALNPFDSGLRVSFPIQSSFDPHPVQIFKGAGEIETSWLGSNSTQGLIGFEKVLNNGIWGEILSSIAYNSRLEDAMHFHHEGIAAFMGNNDRNCIMNLALMFEVAENKARIFKDMKRFSKNKDLLNNPVVSTAKQAAVFRKLITDRDNIAHGREPIHMNSDVRNLIDYLEVSVEFMNSYLGICHEFGWEKVINTKFK
ncbi:hypothetical protein [Methylorubrum aminovorans]|uniref:hypothetical protein n=1 Tax=Methylorubrum aminovorans TaxID=269069 RepID=UPI003C2C54E7